MASTFDEVLAFYRRHGQAFVVGDGILQHHFWGNYYATIGINFGSFDAARDAKRTLGRDWKHGKKSRGVLIWHGTGEQLSARIVPLLASYGADPKKIDSVATSVDRGEPFRVVVATTPHEQTRLFNWTHYSNPLRG